jgi:peptide/nickel transport system substrate-binding protein
MRKSLLAIAVLSLSSAVFSVASAAPYVVPSKWFAGDPDAVKTGGVLRYGHPGEYTGLNYFFERTSGSIPEATSAGGMLAFDPSTLEYIPYQAESYTVSKDKKTWTATIRKGMKWSDGKPVTIDDYLTSYKIYTDPAVESDYADSFFVEVSGKSLPIVFSKLDEDTIKIVFPVAKVDAIETLAFFRVQPAHIFGPVYAANPKKLKEVWPLNVDPKEVVSLGAFKYSSYRNGERLVLEKNPFFGEWNKDDKGRPLPYVDGLTEKQYKDRNAEIAGWLAGDYDVFEPRTGDDIAQTKARMDAGQLKATLKVNIGLGSVADRIAFNHNKRGNDFKKNLFRNAEFRRAVSHVTNRAAMVDIALSGLGSPAYSGVYGYLKQWVNKDVPKFDYDLEKAGAIFKKLGFSKKNADGILVDNKGRALEFDLVYNAPNTRRARLAQVLVSDAKKAGLKINLAPVPNANWSDILGRDDTKADAPDFDAIIAAVGGGGFIFPFSEFQELCKGEGHWWNKSGKCVDAWENQIGALYERGIREFDTKKRIAIGNSIQTIYAQQLPQIYLTALNLHAAWDNRLQNEYIADIISPLAGVRDSNTTWVKQ